MAKINTRSQKWYGWLPDLPDHRDLMYSAIAPALARLPDKVELRPKCSPVENQLTLGSCTANALAGALEFLELKDGNRCRQSSPKALIGSIRMITSNRINTHTAMGAYV